jgi:NAD(P)-dependent dehydrogenase (short-subunit alcohol dehydrogenase family)
MKNYLMAGAGSAIGQQAVNILLEQGHTVYATSRSALAILQNKFRLTILNVVEDNARWITGQVMHVDGGLSII